MPAPTCIFIVLGRWGMFPTARGNYIKFPTTKGSCRNILTTGANCGKLDKIREDYMNFPTTGKRKLIKGVGGRNFLLAE